MSSQTTTDLGHQDIAVVICATFFTVLALVGNAAILYSHVANKLLKYVHSLFIFNMAICDGLLAIAMLLLFAGHMASRKNKMDRCHSFLSVVGALQLEQSFILVLIISDRIVLIRKGLQYNKQSSIPRVWFLVILTWALSIFFAFIDFFVIHQRTESGNFNYFCDDRPEITVDIMSLSIVLLLMVSFVMFVYLWVKVRMLRSKLLISSVPRHRLLTQRSIAPYPSTMQARDDVHSPFVPASSAGATVLSPVDHQSEEVASLQCHDRSIITKPHRSSSLTLTRKKSGGSIRSISSGTPVSQIEVKSSANDSDARSDPGGLEVKGREPLRPAADTRGRKSQVAPGVSFAMSPSIPTAADSRRPSDPAFSNAPETGPIGNQRRLSGVNSESRKISWPKQSDQSMLPFLLHRMTRTGQREVFAVLEVSLLLLMQIMFVLPQCLVSMLLFARAGDFRLVHFYIQWMAFGPILVYPALYVSCRSPHFRR